MKILAIFGDQLSCHGGTKFMAENISALKSVGHTVDLAIATDKKPNKMNFVMPNIVCEGKFADREYIEKLIKLTEEYDLVYIFCVPYGDLKNSEAIQDNMTRLLDGIKKKIVYSSVEHNSKSIMGYVKIEDLCRRADLILTHSTEGVLAKKLKDWKIDTPLHHQYTSRDFSYLRDKYWRPVSDMNLRSATWIGRMTSWKKPDLFAEFAYDKLNPNGYTTTIEGIEMTIVYFSKLKYNRPEDFLDTSRHRSGDHSNLLPGRTYLYNKYVYEEEMERLSHTGFGADLYTLKPNCYGTSPEQSHLDIANVGSVLMCSKSFVEDCHTLSGNRYIDECPELVYLDTDNFDECLDRMNELSQDPELFDKTRERIFEFVKSQCDISVVGPKLSEVLENVL